MTAIAAASIRPSSSSNVRLGRARDPIVVATVGGGSGCRLPLLPLRRLSTCYPAARRTLKGEACEVGPGCVVLLSFHWPLRAERMRAKVGQQCLAVNSPILAVSTASRIRNQRLTSPGTAQQTAASRLFGPPSPHCSARFSHQPCSRGLSNRGLRRSRRDRARRRLPGGQGNGKVVDVDAEVLLHWC